MYNACFLLTQYHRDVTESGIHPFSKPLSLFKVAGCWSLSQYALVASLSQGLALTDRQTHSCSHSHLQANSVKPACLWTAGERWRTRQLYTGRSQLVLRFKPRGHSETSHWTEPCSQQWNTVSVLDSFQCSHETENWWMRDLFFCENYMSNVH